jgi:hypothetical protein
MAVAQTMLIFLSVLVGIYFKKEHDFSNLLYWSFILVVAIGYRPLVSFLNILGDNAGDYINTSVITFTSLMLIFLFLVVLLGKNLLVETTKRG